MNTANSNVIPSRRGKKDYSRRKGDFATIGEVIEFVNEGSLRQKEYLDKLFDSFVAEYERREAAKGIRARIRRLFKRAPQLPPEYLPPAKED